MAGGAGAIVDGLLGLMLADHVFGNYRFIRVPPRLLQKYALSPGSALMTFP
jgi:hypothetical protein